jgi:hypothetical protein
MASLAIGMALLLKVISAYVLLPLAYLAWSRDGWRFLRRPVLLCALGASVLPALAWYLHAWETAADSTTVSTPFWQVHKWISLARFVDLSTYRQLSYFAGLRVLTPIGVLLVCIGVLLRPQLGATTTGRGAMLMHVWFVSLITYFPILLRKLDHEHYYLAVAPVAAVFMGRALVAIARASLDLHCYVRGPAAAAILGMALVVNDWLAFRSTFHVPPEWRDVVAAAEAAHECTPPDSYLAAHSSVLFYADRRGFSFAYGRDEIDYLLGTWSKKQSDPTPEALLEFYRRQGAEYFVELLGTNREQDNAEFFDYVRSHYEILRMEPGKYVVASLTNRQGR